VTLTLSLKTQAASTTKQFNRLYVGAACHLHAECDGSSIVPSYWTHQFQRLIVSLPVWDEPIWTACELSQTLQTDCNKMMLMLLLKMMISHDWTRLRFCRFHWVFLYAFPQNFEHFAQRENTSVAHVSHHMDRSVATISKIWPHSDVIMLTFGQSLYLLFPCTILWFCEGLAINSKFIQNLSKGRDKFNAFLRKQLGRVGFTADENDATAVTQRNKKLSWCWQQARRV